MSDSLLLRIRPKVDGRPHGDAQAIAAFVQEALEQIDMNEVEGHAHAKIPVEIEVKSSADAVERLQVALLTARRKHRHQLGSQWGVGLQKCRLMQAANRGTDKQRQGLDFPEVQLRAEGKG